MLFVKRLNNFFFTIKFIFSVIRTLLEASPNLLTAIDEATGNTALHMALYKNPLMGVLFLKAKDMDLNVKNYAGQTALHLYTIRDDIGKIY